jgi:small conductance mechanosensitive channel
MAEETQNSAEKLAANSADALAKLKEWLVVNGADFVVNLILFILILVVGYFLIKVTLRITRAALDRSNRVTEILKKFILNVLHKVLWVVLIMMALPQLGIEVAPLIAGLGVGGFIVGFAFQESLGNLASGLMLLISQPYAIGDYVEIGGVAGTVREMNIMATLLTTIDNKQVLVPNRRIWGTEIINYTAMPTRRVDLLIGIHYNADIAKAFSVVKDVLDNHELVLKDPEPIIGVKELADSAVVLAVRPWSKTSDYWTVYFDVTRQIKESFDREGVGIPFPQLDLHVIDVPKDFTKSA